MLLPKWEKGAEKIEGQKLCVEKLYCLGWVGQMAIPCQAVPASPAVKSITSLHILCLWINLTL